MTIVSEKLISQKEAAAYLGLNTGSEYYRRKMKEYSDNPAFSFNLPFYSGLIGSVRQYRMDDLNQFRESLRIEP